MASVYFYTVALISSTFKLQLVSSIAPFFYQETTISQYLQALDIKV